MGTEWMGRYRGIVSALVWHGNKYAKIVNVKALSNDGETIISSAEWQVLEYLSEFPNSNSNMAQIAKKLGISTSSFSKLVSSLVKSGLVEKYMRVGNKKDVIIRISSKGQKFYDNMSISVLLPLFKTFFEKLSSFSDEQLKMIEDSILSLEYVGDESENINTDIADNELVRIE